MRLTLLPFVCLVWLQSHPPAYALEDADFSDCGNGPNATYRLAKININTQPIFDENADDAIALHHWANYLHIVTKPFVISERLPFDEGDEVSLKDLIEAEAILRNQRFLSNANIDYDIDCDTGEMTINVTTYDNWSLIPTFSYSRSGGENSTILGIRENNLLGLGVRSAFRYSEDEQRTGFRLSFATPLKWVRHSELFLQLEDNDDGEVYSFAFNKPFYHLGSEYSTSVFATSSQRTEDIFQNGVTRNSLSITTHEFQASYGWQLHAQSNQSSRLIAGFTREDIEFELDPASPNASTLFIPDDRSFTYPFIGFEFIQRNIVVKRDIYLIDQPEDINLGWLFQASIGLDLDNTESTFGTITRVFAQRGISMDKGLLLFKANLRATLNTDIKDYLRLDTRADYVYRVNSLISYYGKITGTFSSGQFLDQPIVLDDDTGVRGFPTQYQHGDHRIAATAEARLYPGWNFYQLFSTGFAAFVDVGRAYGGEFSALNEDEGVLASIGIGARIYSNKASNPGVIHIDIARPMGDGESINSWEWSMQFRQDF